MTNLMKKTKVFNIKIKFTIIAILISLISFGVAALLSTRWMVKEIEDDYREKATLMGTHIIHDLEGSMIRRIHQDVSETIGIYRTYKEVEEVRIFDKNGKEVFTREPGPQEINVGEVLRKGAPIQYQKKMEEKDVTTFILPIKNKPACHTCHEKGEMIRGALLLSLNQKEMNKYIGQQRRRFLLFFGLVAAVTILATVFAVKRFFLNPLKSIQAGAEAIQKGDFKYQISMKSRDEVGTLAENFNNMGQTLQRYFKELEDKNKQLTEQFMLISHSQREWQETFNCITDLICIIDNRFNIIKANRAFHEYISIPPYAEINKKCYELLGTCVRPSCPHVLSMGHKKYINNEIRDEKTGKVLDISYFPYSSPEGDFLGTIFIAKDITEKKEAEIRLIMNERLAALGEMASGIAHELNNPLATISVCTEGLLNRVGKEELDTPLFENYLRMIEEEIQRCKNITMGMLSFVRRTNNDKREIDIHKVLNKAIELINFQGRLKEVVVLRDFQNGVPMVLGNEGELIQLFRVIILNALDAMEDNGTLTLETGNEGNSLFVKISDTGCGIPSGLINRIFDPFFTTKSKKGGTGLGLSIGYSIVKENNGKIDVTSEEGKGTVFTITLPA